ncbi:hypothetical protein F2Q68_00004215 [Brassica cretica]|uniref:Uncharacterized protein n=1 Tax=Brassica cretica TaxID=69181 RepID=A0A8S9JC30_BRACR|nr:hypothetical protein F2Q68_00004215 [Brassica cretica]
MSATVIMIFISYGQEWEKLLHLRKRRRKKKAAAAAAMTNKEKARERREKRMQEISLLRTIPYSDHQRCFIRTFKLTSIVTRQEGEKIYVNSFCPGWVKTAMTGFAGNMSPEDAADTGVWLSLVLSQEAVTGKFFAERQYRQATNRINCIEEEKNAAFYERAILATEKATGDFRSPLSAQAVEMDSEEVRKDHASPIKQIKDSWVSVAQKKQVLKKVEEEIERCKANRTQEEDVSLWLNGRDQYKSVFSSGETWQITRERHQLCHWHNEVCTKPSSKILKELVSLLHAFGFAEDIEDRVEGGEILRAAVLVHVEEEVHGFIGLPGGGEPLGDDREGFRGGADAEGAHAADQGPDGGVEVEAGGDVDREVEGGGGVDVVAVAAVEEVEEVEGLWAVVPEAFED